MRVSDLGEFGLINRIRNMLPSPRPDVIVGIGDDVAVLRTAGPDHLLATCDVQVENVHFARDIITPFQLGHRIVAINVSDIAAMGGAPAWALVSLALPRDIRVDFVDELYRGMQEQIEETGASIVGGNISRSHAEIVIDFLLLGRVSPDKVVLRSGAREGDMILVTGTLGDSRAGLELIRNPVPEISEAGSARVKERHLTPRPRLREGQVLAATGRVRAMADVSDGLLSDLGHICRASGVGGEIWVGEIPISQEAREVANALGLDVRNWALGGGEDYELLFFVDPEAVSEVQRMLEEETGSKGQVIGKAVSESQGIRLLSPDGENFPIASDVAGWDHFGPS